MFFIGKILMHIVVVMGGIVPMVMVSKFKENNIFILPLLWARNDAIEDKEASFTPPSV